jgi:hypothetical protein
MNKKEPVSESHVYEGINLIFEVLEDCPYCYRKIRPFADPKMERCGLTEGMECQPITDKENCLFKRIALHYDMVIEPAVIQEGKRGKLFASEMQVKGHYPDCLLKLILGCIEREELHKTQGDFV